MQYIRLTQLIISTAIHSTQQDPNSVLNNENDVVNAHRPSLNNAQKIQ